MLPRRAVRHHSRREYTNRLVSIKGSRFLSSTIVRLFSSRTADIADIFRKLSYSFLFEEREKLLILE